MGRLVGTKSVCTDNNERIHYHGTLTHPHLPQTRSRHQIQQMRPNRTEDYNGHEKAQSIAVAGQAESRHHTTHGSRHPTTGDTQKTLRAVHKRPTSVAQDDHAQPRHARLSHRTRKMLPIAAQAVNRGRPGEKRPRTCMTSRAFFSASTMDDCWRN